MQKDLSCNTKSGERTCPDIFSVHRKVRSPDHSCFITMFRLAMYDFFVGTGIATFESVYGAPALREGFPGVRMITAAPEIEGVIPAIGELTRRGVICSIGHRCIRTTCLQTPSLTLLLLPVLVAYNDTASPPLILHAREFSQVLVS